MREVGRKKTITKKSGNFTRMQTLFPNSLYKTKHLRNNTKLTSQKYFTKCN